MNFACQRNIYWHRYPWHINSTVWAITITHLWLILVIITPAVWLLMFYLLLIIINPVIIFRVLYGFIANYWYFCLISQYRELISKLLSI